MRTIPVFALLSMVLAVSACTDVTPPVALESEDGWLTGAVGGSVFTIDNPEMTQPCLHGSEEREVVNCNYFKDRFDVWLAGGGLHGKSGLSDGTYVLAVLEPGGQSNPNDGGDRNLSDEVQDDRGRQSGRGNPSPQRQFTVVDGKIATYFGFFLTSEHPTRGLLVQVYPFDFSRNKAGDYVLAVCRISPDVAEAAIDPTPTVSPADCKYDAFRVVPQPPAPPPQLGLISQSITAGNAHSCGLSIDGRAYCWGSNTYGELGDGTTVDRAVPAPVAGDLEFVQIVAGSFHTCALTASGDTYCWGVNGDGQLGDGTMSYTWRSTPGLVSGGIAFRQLSGSVSSNCGLTDSGAAYCWGRNLSGQLGDGTTTSRAVPTHIAPSQTFRHIAVGGDHSCAVTSTGAGYCWGNNEFGQLGTGGTKGSLTPVAVTGGLAFQRVAVFEYRSCGLTDTGAAYCWGQNEDGQLGDGTTTNRPAPTAVSGGHSFVRISTAQYHTCALDGSGTAFCWGSNWTGALGSGSILDVRTAPTAVAGNFQFSQITTANLHTCGVTTSRVAYCWGWDLDGQLGAGATLLKKVFVPTQVSNAGQGGLLFEEIQAGNGTSCGRTPAGDAYCWGINDQGQLGDGGTTSRILAAPVIAPAAFSQVSSGALHSCALHSCSTDGACPAVCWGWNLYGQLGDGTTTNGLEPVAVSGGQQFVQVSAGSYHSCGLNGSGAAYCWGKNDRGQLGDGTTTNRSVPTPVIGGVVFSAISAGDSHTCALDLTGAAHCWGWDGIIEHHQPFPVEGGLVFDRITTGDRHTCGLTESGEAYCWGINPYGQLGEGTTLGRFEPTPVLGGYTFKDIQADHTFTCALTNDGQAYCWGWNLYGQLGDGTTSDRATPTAVATAVRFERINGGIDHTCALSQGTTYCWGKNDYGQLGNNTKTSSLTPTIVTKMLFMR